MATISDISNAAQYRGTAELGGSLGAAVTLDTSPLQRLATFTYYRDKDLWEKKKADDKLAADKIATIAAFDVTSPLKPYTEDLKKGLDELKQFVRDNPNALNYDKDPKLYQELVDRYGALQIKRKNATANDALYNAAKAKIELMPNKADRDVQLELLDLKAKNLFANGVEDAYNQQFESTPELKPDDYKIPTIPMTEAFTITRNANDTVIEGRAYADVDRLKSLASAAYFEMRPSLDKNSAAYKNLSPEGKRRAELEDSIIARKRITLDGIANNVNGLVQQFKAQPGNENITVAEIPEETLTKNSSIGGFIRLVKNYNKQIDEVNAATGKKYGYINLDDGATPEEIIELQSFGANGETLYKELKPTVQQTDNAIQGRSQTEQERHNRALEAIGWKNAEDDGSGEAPVNLLQGNALNDIEIPTNTKPGIYTMGGKGGGNKKNVANIQRLLVVPDREGKKKPILTKERLESNKEDQRIEYEVVDFDGKPYVARLKVDNVWYDRGFFRNSQLTADTEPLKGQRTTYRDSQNYGEGSLKTSTSGNGGGSYLIKGKRYTESELIGMGYSVDQIKPYKK